jgi:hypothetical protein
MTETGAPTVPGRAANLRRAALLWALGHAPLIYLCSIDSAIASLAGLPLTVRVGLFAAWGLESLFLALVPWLLTLPLSPWRRVYRVAAPLVCSIALVAYFVDGRIFRLFNLHVNGLLLRIIVQPPVLNRAGLEPVEQVVIIGLGLLVIGLGAWLGWRFLGRVTTLRPAWRLALAVALLQGAERAAVGAMTFYAGPAVAAAGQVFPMQFHLSVNKLMRRLTGKEKYAGAGQVAEALQRSAASPYGDRRAADVRFAQRPDVVLILIESLRDQFLDERTMPHLHARAQQGARFTNHHTSGTSTHYSVFSVFMGLDARRFDATIAAGRRPLIFGALQENGYRTDLLAASSVDWMGLEETVFRDVAAVLQTRFPGRPEARDSVMLATALQHVRATPDTTPLFTFLFVVSTHFAYSFPAGQAPFTPYWEGGHSAMSAVRAEPQLLQNRARNSAYEVDRKLDEFLRAYARMRGREPLVLVTGDHGEEYRENGRLGHGYDVSWMLTHVPMVISGPGIAPLVSARTTSHADLVPTILAQLGDTTDPRTWSDGVDMFRAPAGRFVISIPGWVPRYAVIGEEFKASFFGFATGLGDMTVTDLQDRPLPDGTARLARHAPEILGAISLTRGR